MPQDIELASLPTEVTNCHSCGILLVTQASSDSVWEGTTQRCEQPEDAGDWTLVTTNLISVHPRDGASYMEIFQK